MKKSRLEEILSVPELSFLLEAEEFFCFLEKKQDAEYIPTLYNSEKIDKAFLSEMNLGSGELFTEARDSVASEVFGEAMRDILIRNQNKINSDKLILFLGGFSLRYLKAIDTFKNTGKYNEVVYTNGDIYSLKNGKVYRCTKDEGKYELSDDEIDAFKKNLAIGALKARKMLEEYTKKGKSFSIRGTYTKRGEERSSESFDISLEDLNKACRTGLVLKYFTAEEIKKLQDSRYITQGEILKALRDGEIDRNLTFELIKLGIVKREEALRKVFKVNNYDEIVKGKNETLETKLVMYSLGLTSIETLERYAAVSKDRDERCISPEFYSKISKRFDIKKIGELIMHDVLSYKESIDFLDTLEKERIIREDDRKSLEQGMNDFKCKELLNSVETEALDKKDRVYPPYAHIASLSIDPRLRLEYFKSIGAVKRVKIRGEIAIEEDEEERKKINSLDGYELLLIPDKKIAILEKFYEVTRDKDSHIQYKTNEKGEYIPAVGNATYIIPMALAKDLIEKKNKKELIKSPHVHRAFHTADWVNSVEKKMKWLNPSIEFRKENTDLWKKRTAESYSKNKRSLDEI